MSEVYYGVHFCVVFREGRASLVTTFSLFQFMALYSIAEFVTAATLYFVSCETIALIVTYALIVWCD